MLKVHKNIVTHNYFYGCLIILKFSTEHGSNTAVLFAKFQNEWMTEMDFNSLWSSDAI